MMTAQQQDERTARAMREDYDWTEAGNGAWICETADGNEYLVWEDACQCKDWEYRVSKQPGAKCKHQIALGHKLIAEGASLCAKGLRMMRDEQPEKADLAATSEKLSNALGRNVIWGEREEKAFDRIFG
jgi:hypothetical protein